MKTFATTLKLALIGLMFSLTSLHAQWDTIENFPRSPWGGWMNDMCFISNTGYAVGHIADTSAFFNRVGNISKTIDGGLTWNTSQLPMVIGNDSIIDLRSVYFTTPNVGYVAAIGMSYSNFTNSFYGVVLKTTNGGLTWSSILSTKNQIVPNVSTILFNSVQFTSINSGFVAASNQSTLDLNYQNTGSGLVFKTTNAGINWTSSNVFAGTFACSVFFDNSGTGSVAGGVTMNNFGSFFGPYNDYYRLDITPGEIARSTDGGNTWSTTYTDPLNGIADINFPSVQMGYAVSISGSNGANVLKTINGGQTWNVINTFSAFPNFQPRCIYFINDTTGFIGGWSWYQSSDAIFKTTDGGITWNVQTFPNVNNYLPRIVAFASTSPVTYYALSDSADYNLNYSSSILGNFPTTGCSVFLGPDTTFCQTQGQLFATPGTPGNNYVFDWTPGIGLSDSTGQAPFVSQVQNQQYIVTMTDTVTNCVASDTIVVTAHNMITSPQYICTNDSTLLDFGPGATNYFWQFYTDTAGNVSSITQNTQTYWATQQGYYLGFAQFTGCGALTSNVQVLDTCGTYAWVNNVWPGDCNYDLTANNADVLQIGLAYNTTGATRPSATNGWYAQPMVDWSQNYVNCNYKHGDANGDGIINVNDTLPISLNYGNTHPYRLQPVVVPATAPLLYLVANYDTVGLQTLVTVDIRLGTTAIPVDSIYGISFRISSDAGLIDTTMTIVNLNNTWLGTMNSTVFGFRKNFNSFGIVDVAECGNNHVNRVNGNGSIGSFLIVTTDNLSGIAVCHFDLSDITAITLGQEYLTLNTAGDSVVIDSNHPAGINEFGVSSFGFSIYPNPANENVIVQTNSLASTIEICDLQGRIVSTLIPNSNSTTINTALFAEGIYLLRVKNGNSVSTQKLSVVH